MKKYYFIFAAAMAFLAACNNEDNVVSNDPTPSELQNITYIRAEADEGATTRGSVDDEATFTWNTGDKIAVYTTDGYKISNALGSDDDGKSSVDFAFTSLTDANRSNFAIYPASLVWDGTNIRSGSASAYTSSSLTLTLPASYTLADVQNEVSPTPMIATNAPDGSLSFKALCPLLRVTVNNIPKQTKRLEFDFNGKKVQGEFMLTSVDVGTTAIATSATDDTDDIITVTMEDNTTWHDNLVVNLPVPTGTYSDITITAYDATSGGQKVLSIKTPIKSTAAWKPTRKASRKMSATLPVFTVSSSKKVIFSPGNLQAYNATAYSKTGWVWSFATTQWGYIGGYDYLNSSTSGPETCNNRMTTGGTIEVSGTVDLFGWSTSSSYYGITSANYNANMYSGSFQDWGNNVIGSYAANTWRTLSGGSSGEWRYLFKSRAASTVNSTANARFAKAKVNSIHGVILFPDTYTHPAGVTLPVGINDADGKTGWDGNAYTIADWGQMEVAGAVFLPAGGCRTQTRVFSSGSAGSYWASTNNGDYAQFIEFWSTYLGVESSQQRYTGCSVRLVRDVK